MEKLCSKTHVQGHSATPEHAALSLSLLIDAACPGVSLRTNQPRPTGVTGSSRINSKWCHLSSRFMCPHVHPCVPTFIHASPRTNPVVCFKNKRARQCKTFQRLGTYAAHTSQNTTVEKLCGKTHVQGHNATPEYAALALSLSLSLNRCSLSWGFSDDEAATSYGRNKIKSY